MPRNLFSEGMRRRGIRRGSTGGYRGVEDDLSSASESRNVLSVPVDDYDNSTDCEEIYEDDDGAIGFKRKPRFSFSESEDERDGEYLTDIEYSSDENDDNLKESSSCSQAKVTRRSAKELSLYIQRVLGRPLRAVTCFKECEHGGTVIQTEHPDEDETSEDESSLANEMIDGQENEQESCPDSQVSDIEASDGEDYHGIDLNHDGNPNNNNNNNNGEDDGNVIDSYLQGHFARLSTTDNDARGRSDSEIDESHLPPGIIVSNWGGSSVDNSHPVTEEEILSEREVTSKPSNVIRTKRMGRTRGQFSKQSNYLTASLPTLGQGETDSESESDGRQLIRSSFYQTSSGSSNFRDDDDENSPETHGILSNLPSTDSESFEFEDEDDSVNINPKYSPRNSLTNTANESQSVKIVSQLSINDNMIN